MYCVLIHAVFFPPYIEFSHIYCASLHVLFFLYILCAASCLTLGFMYCVLLHVLRLTPCIVCCVVSRLMLDPHACVLCHGLCLTPCLYAMSCLVLDSMSVCCVMACACLHALVLCCVTACACPHALCAIPYIPFFFMHAKGKPSLILDIYLVFLNDISKISLTYE